VSGAFGLAQLVFASIQEILMGRKRTKRWVKGKGNPSLGDKFKFFHKKKNN
jgi:hypothetical protein